MNTNFKMLACSLLHYDAQFWKWRIDIYYNTTAIFDTMCLLVIAFDALVKDSNLDMKFSSEILVAVQKKYKRFEKNKHFSCMNELLFDAFFFLDKNMSQSGILFKRVSVIFSLGDF